MALDLLRTLFLIQLLRPWTPNLTSREVGRPKALVADSGLAARLARLSPDLLVETIGSGHLGGPLEAFVVAELGKQAGWTTTPFELFHYRDQWSPA